MGYSYRYTSGPPDERPLRSCPGCGNDLTRPGGVTLELVVGGRAVHFEDWRLADDGRLPDTDDDAVAHGHHGGTVCNGCGELLIDLEGVYEHQDTT